MFKISVNVIEAFLIGAKNAFPKEFFALLGSTTESNLIDEFIVIKNINSEKEVLFNFNEIPIDFSIKGSMHSHTSNNNNPSKADIQTFKKIGGIHLIACFPFNRNTIKAFNFEGKELKFKEIKY